MVKQAFVSEVNTFATAIHDMLRRGCSLKRIFSHRSRPQIQSAVQIKRIVNGRQSQIEAESRRESLRGPGAPEKSSLNWVGNIMHDQSNSIEFKKTS